MRVFLDQFMSESEHPVDTLLIVVDTLLMIGDTPDARSCSTLTTVVDIRPAGAGILNIDHSC